MAVWFNSNINLSTLNDLGENSMPGNLGIEFTAVGDNWLKARMPINERTKQPWGRLHGGASVALAETVASVAASLTLDPSQSLAVGLEINANHVRGASAGFVHAQATAESVGRTTQVWSFRIMDDDARLISIGRITLAVIPFKAESGAPTIEAAKPGERKTPKSRFNEFLETLMEGFG